VTTRFLLSIAAVAVAGGLVNIPNAYLFNALSVAAPWALGVAAGLYLLPGILAQALFRRGGVGILAMLLAGLAAAPFVPTGIASVSAYAVLGILIEIPFAIALYRYWKSWMFFVSAAWVAAFYSVFWGLFYNTPALGPLVLIGQPALLLVSIAVITAIALLIADRVARTGVLRGLRGDLDRQRTATA
jgi:energy-coupling factor transport system substrate-specific component